MIRTQVQLTREQMELLRAAAVKRGTSIAALIREAVDQHLSRADAEGPRERALRSIGGFRSGQRDVSEEHDHYLAEDFSR